MLRRRVSVGSKSSLSTPLNRNLWRIPIVFGAIWLVVGVVADHADVFGMGSQSIVPVSDSMAVGSIGEPTVPIAQTDIGSNDPLLDQQWHLKSRSEEAAGSTVRAAWPTTKGAGIVIGIVDDGLQHTHPDLQLNYVPSLSWDFNGNDADPSPRTVGLCSTTADCHGTAVAGVAGARGDNGVGVSGAAPLVSLAGLRLIADPISDAQIATALGHQADTIHISSNSWGPFDCSFLDCTLVGPGPLAQLAMETAVTQGRSGKGRIFTFAAGNGLQNQDNCNFNGFANNRFVFAVGAIADNAQQAFYSEPCSALFVTAPSNGGSRGITTTDLLGSAGYHPTDYTSSFGGTSSATPLVSGVVALMLAQNPSLTWRDVKHVLVRSSVRINLTDPGWTSGMFAHNEKFGFGLVDAQAAVNLAATWSNVAAESAIPAVTRVVNRTIPDNDTTGLLDSMTISSAFVNFSVEHVEVEFDATHPFRGDLEVTLISPAGIASRLATVRPLDSGFDFSSWRFGSVRHWGEAAAGAWTLRVADLAVSDVGIWNSWTLRVYGTPGPPPPTVTTGSLPVGERGAAYLHELSAEGGFPPYTWSRLKGKLPNGLTLDAAGTINGVPTKSKTSTFTAQVIDVKGVSATKEFSLQVIKAINLKDSSLSRGTVGTPYSASLQTRRGIPPLTFSLIDGTLPPGLTLDPETGQISGVPTTAGTFDFQTRVTSSGGSSDQEILRIKIRRKR